MFVRFLLIIEWLLCNVDYDCLWFSRKVCDEIWCICLALVFLQKHDISSQFYGNEWRMSCWDFYQIIYQERCDKPQKHDTGGTKKKKNLQSDAASSVITNLHGNDDNPSYVRFCRIKIGPNIHKFTKNISKVDSSGVAWASSRQQHIIDSSSSRTLKESKTEKIKNLTLNFILTVMNSWILLLLLFIFPVDFIRK